MQILHYKLIEWPVGRTMIREFAEETARVLNAEYRQKGQWKRWILLKRIPHNLIVNGIVRDTRCLTKEQAAQANIHLPQGSHWKIRFLTIAKGECNE